MKVISKVNETFCKDVISHSHFQAYGLTVRDASASSLFEASPASKADFYLDIKAAL
jgi:hypothetical protein